MPDPRLSPEAHLDCFERDIDRALELSPERITTLAGCDAWPLEVAAPFFARLCTIARDRAIPLSVETHRSRPTFSPWSTLALLDAVPELRLTADLSHWIVVCERLVLDDDPSLIETIAPRVDHFHARVGYAQGAQVPDPRAPEYATEVEAHLRWWRILLERTATRTATPEFGPDGYLQQTPFTMIPASDLRDINAWMASQIRTLG